jgi:hypothetical protein
LTGATDLKTYLGQPFIPEYVKAILINSFHRQNMGIGKEKGYGGRDENQVADVLADKAMGSAFRGKKG